MGIGSNPVFVVGASRSGTAMVRSSLNRHPAVHIAGETHYFDDLRVKMSGRERAPLSPEDRQECEDYFLRLAHRPYGHAGDPAGSPLARESLRNAADAIGPGADSYFEAYCKAERQLEGRGDDHKRWGEKTPRHVFRLAEILARYPTGQAVVMVRDPRAVVASYRNWRNQGGFDLEADPGHAEALVVEEARARASYDPSIASLLWKATVAAADAARSQFGSDRVLVQRYEDLVQEPEAALRRLADWLSLEFGPDMLEVPLHNSSFSQFEANAGHSTEPIHRWKKTLSDREVAVVQMWCRKKMTQLGYTYEPVNTSAVDVAIIAAQLPMSLFRAAAANRDRMGNMPAYLWRRWRLATAR